MRPARGRDGTFKQLSIALTINQVPGYVVSGDFNRDGITDIATFVGSGDGTNQGLLIFLGRGDGTFSLYQTVSSGPYRQNVLSLDVGDFNGDGILDISAVGSQTNIFTGNGDGSFNLVVPLSLYSGQVAGELGDVNGDGLTDFVDGFSVWLAQLTQTATGNIGVLSTGVDQVEAVYLAPSKTAPIQ